MDYEKDNAFFCHDSRADIASSFVIEAAAQDKGLHQSHDRSEICIDSGRDVHDRGRRIAPGCHQQTLLYAGDGGDSGAVAKVMGSNPSMFNACGDDCPVENISWVDVQEFIRRLNQKEGINKYRLPTEAEWEFACRAGSAVKDAPGVKEDEFGDYAWYDANSDRKTHPVATKKPNAWGLYDMHGNVSEWCQDWYDDYPEGQADRPEGPVIRAAQGLAGWLMARQHCDPECTFRSEDYAVVQVQ